MATDQSKDKASPVCKLTKKEKDKIKTEEYSASILEILKTADDANTNAITKSCEKKEKEKVEGKFPVERICASVIGEDDFLKKTIKQAKTMRERLVPFILREREYFARLNWSVYTSAGKEAECKWWLTHVSTFDKLPPLIRDHLRFHHSKFRLDDGLRLLLMSDAYESYESSKEYVRHDFWDKQKYFEFKEEIDTALENMDQSSPKEVDPYCDSVPEHLSKLKLRRNTLYRINSDDSDDSKDCDEMERSKCTFENFIKRTRTKSSSSSRELSPDENISTISIPVVPSLQTDSAPTSSFILLDCSSSPILAAYLPPSAVVLTTADVARLWPAETKEEEEESDEIKSYLSTHCSPEEMTRYQTHLSAVAALKKKFTTAYLVEEFVKRGVQIPIDDSSRLPASIFDGKDLGPTFVPIVAPFQAKAKRQRV